MHAVMQSISLLDYKIGVRESIRALPGCKGRALLIRAIS